VKQHVRVRDVTRQGAGTPPVVVWKCAGKRHTMLRVFLNKGGWHVLGNSFRVPLREWLERQGAQFTVEDIHERADTDLPLAMPIDAHRIEGVDQELPLDVGAWPVDIPLGIGCGCGQTIADLTALAADCVTARDTRNAVYRSIGVS
jgi:hypothetical protein